MRTLDTWSLEWVNASREACEASRLRKIDSPALYEARTTVREGGSVLDEELTTFGIRQLQADPRRGLRINGQPVKLRGAWARFAPPIPTVRWITVGSMTRWR